MNRGTTGASSRPSPGGDASTSGANTAAGVNNTGHGHATRAREGRRQQTVRDTSTKEAARWAGLIPSNRCAQRCDVFIRDVMTGYSNATPYGIQQKN